MNCLCHQTFFVSKDIKNVIFWDNLQVSVVQCINQMKDLEIDFHLTLKKILLQNYAT